jgi:hypothetical protein
MMNIRVTRLTYMIYVSSETSMLVLELSNGYVVELAKNTAVRSVTLPAENKAASQTPCMIQFETLISSKGHFALSSTRNIIATAIFEARSHLELATSL